MDKQRGYIKKIISFGATSLRNSFARDMYYETTPKLARLFQKFFAIRKSKLLIFGSANVSALQYQFLKAELKKYPKIKVKRYDTYFGYGLWSRLVTMPYHLATSKVIVLEDVFRPTKYLNNENQTIIQMWHALGAFKRFGLANQENLKKTGQALDEIQLTYTYDYFLDPGLKFRDCYRESFTKGAKAIEGIFNPRIDVLFNKEISESFRNQIYKLHPQLLNKKVLLYTPTYRGLTNKTNSNHFINFDALLDNLPEDYIIVLKKHPSMLNSQFTLPSTKNLHRFFDITINVNELMLVSDILINDYSSTFFEFALLGKPCMFFAKDIDKYIDERGFYFPYHDFVPGPISMNENNLAKDILEHGQDNSQVKTFVDEYFGKVPPNNTQLFAAFINNIINS